MDSPVSHDAQAAFDRERRQARAHPPADAAAFRTQTVQMYGRLASLQADAIARTRVAFACRRGCSYCCHLRVEIRPHEAFTLAHHIATKFDAGRRARTLRRIEENRQRIAPLSPTAHVRAGIACALLDDNGVCTVYEARPAACRKYHSMSVDVCRNAFNDTDAPLTGEIEHEEVRLAGNAVALGFAKGLEDAGYDIALYELHDALHRALTDPRSERRYRHGKRAFVE
ncbi:MAG TPA: YkgJ family cysteine cluster protein [Casimicrobiaceae bacterium]|nr:YkgJ family cysteine cluster protein [Casimicrobiaceae bacterium]